MEEYKIVHVVVLTSPLGDQKLLSFRTMHDAEAFRIWIANNSNIHASYVGEREYMLKGQFRDN